VRRFSHPRDIKVFSLRLPIVLRDVTETEPRKARRIRLPGLDFGAPRLDSHATSAIFQISSSNANADFLRRGSFRTISSSLLRIALELRGTIVTILEDP